MSRIKLLGVAVVAAAALAAPSAASAQVDVGAACHALVGSDSTNATVVGVSRCNDAGQPAVCSLGQELNLLVVRIRHGLCIDISEAMDERRATVGGVATVQLLP